MTYHVLLLEDNPRYANVAKEAIETNDPDALVRVAFTSEEARAFVSQMPRDDQLAYLVADLYLTQEDSQNQGLDFIRWLWLESGRGAVPVFVLSAVLEYVNETRRSLSSLPAESQGMIAYGSRSRGFAAWRESLSKFIDIARERLRRED